MHIVHRHKFTDASAALTFMLAGKAHITTVSKKTGTRFTYRIAKVKEDTGGPATHFVGVLNGTDNNSAYAYIGYIHRDGNFVYGRKSKIDAEAPSVKGFVWTYVMLKGDKLSEHVEIWHEGKCGRCARRLTVPESIARGIGPECASMVTRRGVIAPELPLPTPTPAPKLPVWLGEPALKEAPLVPDYPREMFTESEGTLVAESSTLGHPGRAFIVNGVGEFREAHKVIDNEGDLLYIDYKTTKGEVARIFND